MDSSELGETVEELSEAREQAVSSAFRKAPPCVMLMDKSVPGLASECHGQKLIRGREKSSNDGGLKLT